MARGPARARVRAAVERVVPGGERLTLTARFGDLRRTAPLTSWGGRRGKPVDRWYVERFLHEHADLVSGRVLEVKSDQYASSLGADEVEVLDIDPANRLATVVGDLCDPGTLRPDRYDAALVTQTLMLVADPLAAVRHLATAVRPGGAVLLTVPALSRLVGPEDRWRWTPAGFEQLLHQAVPEAAVAVSGLGNGLAARAFLFGLAAEDLPDAALAVQDDAYPLLVGAVLRVPTAA